VLIGEWALMFWWRKRVAASQLDDKAKAVLHALALHMDALGGSCFPSQGTLARETSLSRWTVARALRRADPGEERGRLVERVTVWEHSPGKPPKRHTHYHACDPTTGLRLSETPDFADVAACYIGRGAPLLQEGIQRYRGEKGNEQPYNDLASQAGRSRLLHPATGVGENDAPGVGYELEDHQARRFAARRARGRAG
jgi:Helix-turn-helix domain